MNSILITGSNGKMCHFSENIGWSCRRDTCFTHFMAHSQVSQCYHSSNGSLSKRRTQIPPIIESGNLISNFFLLANVNKGRMRNSCGICLTEIRLYRKKSHQKISRKVESIIIWKRRFTQNGNEWNQKEHKVSTAFDPKSDNLFIMTVLRILHRS